MPARELDEVRLRRLIDVGRTVVSELDLESVLSAVIDAARELTGARYAALGILNAQRDGLERFITSGIDQETRRRIGHLPAGRGVLGVLITDPKPLRLSNVGDHPRSYGFPAHHPPMTSFLGVPVMIRGHAFGNLYLTEKEGGEFDEVDEESVVVLAGWAAIAIENARSIAQDRLRRTMEASDRERKFWARELHDETLQGLGALRLLLASALRSGTQEALESAVRDAVDGLLAEIENLRGVITELRPAALDELGLAAAIEALAERSSATGGLEIQGDVTLSEASADERLSPELESTIYRLVQEALNNVVKHARAERAEINVTSNGHEIAVEVSDDGIGFDPDVRSPGFGLTGMRERLDMVGGTLEIDAAVGRGTTLRAVVPVMDESRAEI